jgi:hypothetical protein
MEDPISKVNEGNPCPSEEYAFSRYTKRPFFFLFCATTGVDVIGPSAGPCTGGTGGVGDGPGAGAGAEGVLSAGVFAGIPPALGSGAGLGTSSDSQVPGMSATGRSHVAVNMTPCPVFSPRYQNP